MNSNDLARGLKRAVDDLSSYYLLGYYSSGRLDGRFHSITVRVKRPGVQVRARRGYLAATPGAATAAARAAAVPAPAGAETLALQTALASLAEFQRDVPLRVHVATGWRPFDSMSLNRSNSELAQDKVSAQPAFWVVAEFGSAAPVPREVDATVVSAAGATIGRATAPGNARSVLIPMSPSERVPAGEYTVRVRAEGFGAGALTVTLPAAPEAGGAVFFRRGPTTANKEVPVADLRFRRSERIRIDVPTPDATTVAARLLDRTGKPLSIPLTATVRADTDGSRWQTTELALAPLAPGDYVIELAGGAGQAGREVRTLAAFRVVP